MRLHLMGLVTLATLLSMPVLSLSIGDDEPLGGGVGGGDEPDVPDSTVAQPGDAESGTGNGESTEDDDGAEGQDDEGDGDESDDPDEPDAA